MSPNGVANNSNYIISNSLNLKNNSDSLILILSNVNLATETNSDRSISYTSIGFQSLSVNNLNIAY